MEIRPKSPAELTSQAMAFAHEQGMSGVEKEEIAAMAILSLGDIASHNLYPDYAHFLRMNRELVSKRTALQENYETHFRPTVDHLRQSIDQSAHSQQHEAFIGSGTQANVFAFTQNDKEYVARALKYDVSDKVLIDRYVAGTLQVQGLPHFEQIVATSYDDEVTIAERMPGRQSSDVSLEDINQVSEVQLHELIDTLAVAQDKGVRLDTIPENYMYDKEAGFGLIDLESIPDRPDSYYGTLRDKITQTVTVLAKMGEKGQKYSSLDTDKLEFYQEQAALMQARIGLLQRYAVASKEAAINQEDYTVVDRAIDTEIHFLRQSLDKYTDSEWVDGEIKRAVSRHYPSVSEAPKVQHEESWDIPSSPVGF